MSTRVTSFAGPIRHVHGKGNRMSSAPQPRPVIAIGILGLGEAGSAIAADLVATGADIRGFDPLVPAPPGVAARADEADACGSVQRSQTCCPMVFRRRRRANSAS
jgi:hypothetical protein